MRLSLRDLINEPGGRKPFSFELDVSDLWFDSVLGFTEPVAVEGRVENHAGALTAVGAVRSRMKVVCARCLKEFERKLDIPFTANLSEELEDEDSEDIYLIEDGEADLDEIANTALVLGMETRFFCKEDCKGLCPKCGKNLNEGPCGCGEDLDPRLAVLGQLLENND